MRWLAALALFATGVVAAAPAGAEEPSVSTSGKGIAGGILLGGELAAFAGGLFRVEPDWVFGSGIAIGAAAGGVAGFVVERNAESRASDVLLIAGMGLLVPVIVWVGDLRAPRPAERLSLTVLPELGRGDHARGLRVALAASFP